MRFLNWVLVLDNEVKGRYGRFRASRQHRKMTYDAGWWHCYSTSWDLFGLLGCSPWCPSRPSLLTFGIEMSNRDSSHLESRFWLGMLTEGQLAPVADRWPLQRIIQVLASCQDLPLSLRHCPNSWPWWFLSVDQTSDLSCCFRQRYQIESAVSSHHDPEQRTPARERLKPQLPRGSQGTPTENETVALNGGRSHQWLGRLWYQPGSKKVQKEESMRFYYSGIIIKAWKRRKPISTYRFAGMVDFMIMGMGNPTRRRSVITSLVPIVISWA